MRTPLCIIRTLFLKFQLHREVLKDTSLFSGDTLCGFNGVHSREVNSTVNLTVHVHNYIFNAACIHRSIALTHDKSMYSW